MNPAQFAACPNTGYIQFVQHPTSGNAALTGSQTIRIVQQQQQMSTPSESQLTSPVGDSGFVDQTERSQSQQQQPQHTVHSYGANAGGMLESNASAKFITAQITTGPSSQSIQSASHQPMQLNNRTVLVTNANDSSSGLPSAVKIQDDLCLTEAQVNSVHNLFQGANRVSRPEKAMIVSFIAGARGNPHPEAGNTLRIRLSEYRERVLNQATGQLMDVAADTYLHMDYATGKCEKVKYYRNEPPEVLLRLPVQPAALH
ncbi:unnamed protein product [Echinostoma caproni]|uniref:Uncharacterized protein n=1 Tax=Echinostoma caproni TaxID=27848 RepID=A0A183AXZ2_9TREM|nr:unnamed protein product [Echinostoma caproni]